MIKYENTEKCTSLEASGSIIEITSDIIQLIRLVHERLYSAGKKDVASAFKDVITDHVGIAFMDDGDIDKEIDKLKKNSVEESAKKLADSVRDLDADELDSLFNEKGEK